MLVTVPVDGAELSATPTGETRNWEFSYQTVSSTGSGIWLPVRPSFFLQLRQRFFFAFLVGTGGSDSSSLGWAVFLGLISAVSLGVTRSSLLTMLLFSATDSDKVVSLESGVVFEVELEAWGCWDRLWELGPLLAVSDGGGGGGVCVDEDVVGGPWLSASFFNFSLKQTEHSPSLSVVLKNPQPLLQSEGKAAWGLESMFCVLILAWVALENWKLSFALFVSSHPEPESQSCNILTVQHCSAAIQLSSCKANISDSRKCLPLEWLLQRFPARMVVFKWSNVVITHWKLTRGRIITSSNLFLIKF